MDKEQLKRQLIDEIKVLEGHQIYQKKLERDAEDRIAAVVRARIVSNVQKIQQIEALKGYET